MKFEDSLRCWRVKVRFAVLLVYLGLATAPVLSQSASLRGTAKLNGTLVVEGVMVVAVSPSGKLRPQGTGTAKGTPLPSKVSNTGDYRIEGLTKGSYDLIAIGKSIKKKVLAITVQAGNDNVVNLALERPPKKAKVRVTIKNSGGVVLNNTQVAIYSAELPPSLCADCKLDELTTDTNGEINYSDIAGEEAYSLAVRIPGAGNVADTRLTADAITLGAESVAHVEMRVGDGAQPVLTATLLPSRELPAPGVQRQQQLNAPDLALKRVWEEKLTISGTVIRRDSDSFVVRDKDGKEMIVRLASGTNVEAEDSTERRRKIYAQTEIMRGLTLQVEGQRNDSGELVAGKVSFKEADLRALRSVYPGPALPDERFAKSDSPEPEKVAAVSNAINPTNERIYALADYETKGVFAVNFSAGSAQLTSDVKAQLDQIAVEALKSKGYVLEVSGFSDATGSMQRNRNLSQRRADAVIRYLVEHHQIALRRILTPYDYGESVAVAENTTRAGRSQSRRVEIRLLVNSNRR